MPMKFRPVARYVTAQTHSMIFLAARMVTGAQIRAARALIGWSATTLAQRSGVSYRLFNALRASMVFRACRLRIWRRSSARWKTQV